MRYRRGVGACLVVAIWVVLLSPPSFGQGTRPFERVLIESPKPYDRLRGAIARIGGRVTNEYEHVDAVAAEVPLDAIEILREGIGSAIIDKDLEIANPSAHGPARVRSAASSQVGAIATVSSRPLVGNATGGVADFAAEYPDAYSLNNAGTKIEELHRMGLTGRGTIVAVIDSGVRQGFEILADSIVGGIDFVDDGIPGPAGDGPDDWKKDSNDGHGTQVASLISGNALFETEGVLRDAINRYAPKALLDGTTLPLIGSAPESGIYVVRVFGEQASAGARLATILEAIEHVVELRKLYNRTGGRRGLKIDVCNLSFGISTLAAGRTLLDRSVDALLKAGIVPVVSVGNTGPSALTTASPGSSMSAVTVGAIGRAENERILYDVLYGTDFQDSYYPGIGQDLRPFAGVEVAWFSSRGPNADGRGAPHVVANGVGAIGQGYCPDQILDACFNHLSVASGTSFTSPIISGMAAVLVQAFPNASATEIRNAIVDAGQIAEIDRRLDEIDRGHGLPDATLAYELLLNERVDDVLPRANPPDDLVRRNVERNTKLEVHSGFHTRRFEELIPGQRAEILYEVPRGTERVIVRVRDIQMTGEQNPFYGSDALFVYIHSAKTSSIRAFGDYLTDGFAMFDGDEQEFVHEDPDTGIMRITLNPDTLNGGLVNAEVTVEAVREMWPRATFTDRIRDGKTRKYSLKAEKGTRRLEFLLTWGNDWAHYPVSDLDLVIRAPDGTQIRSGATLAGPERVTINDPMAGKWRVEVIGFNIPAGTDEFKLRISTDNRIVTGEH